VLHYDAREQHFATSVEALVARVEGETVALRPRVAKPPDVAYGRVARGSDGRRWAQYWLLYAQNPQDRGVVRTGRHEGDWEMVQVALDGSRDATYAQHNWAARCAWTGEVFVAHGSHASYPRPGDGDRPWPDPTDEVRGDGRVVRPEVRPFGAWVRWPGRWGRAGARWWIPSEAPSPRGPAFQESTAWADPSERHREARPCAAGAPLHPWPVYAAGAAVVAALLFLVLRRLRRRLGA
jgi:hypothetical protein